MGGEEEAEVGSSSGADRIPPVGFVSDFLPLEPAGCAGTAAGTLSAFGVSRGRAEEDLWRQGVPIAWGRSVSCKGAYLVGRAIERPAEELMVCLLKKEENQVMKLLLNVE